MEEDFFLKIILKYQTNCWNIVLMICRMTQIVLLGWCSFDNIIILLFLNFHKKFHVNALDCCTWNSQEIISFWNVHPNLWGTTNHATVTEIGYSFWCLMWTFTGAWPAYTVHCCQKQSHLTVLEWQSQFLKLFLIFFSIFAVMLCNTGAQIKQANVHEMQHEIMSYTP